MSIYGTLFFEIIQHNYSLNLFYMVSEPNIVIGKTTTKNIPENAADIISPNLQESMTSNNQRAAIINHQKHK